MGLLNPNTLLPLLLAFVVGITIHEFAHAFVAYQMGDMTPKVQGRLTLNPLAHMTLWGTLLIFLIGFGWGKPVQHRIWDHRRRLWVSLAGPVSNIVLAALLGLVVRAGVVPAVGPNWFFLPNVIHMVIFINILLAVFNMLPLSPLDGSSVFAGILPDPWGQRLAEYNARYPQALIVFLLADFFLGRYILGTSILSLVLGPPIGFFHRLFTGA
jgi:Zn-dependent protease